MADSPITVTPSKKPWESKTVWMNFTLTVLGLFIPPVKEWITTHPDIWTLIFGVANFALRLVTKGAIALGD